MNHMRSWVVGLCWFVAVHNLGSATPVAIESRIEEGPWEQRAAIYPLLGQKVELRVDEVKGAAVRWYQIIPDISQNYKNANYPWDPEPYQWIGYAEIKYDRVELTKLRDQWVVRPPFTMRPFWPWGSKPEAGSFWMQVEIETDGRIDKSPGIEGSDKRGLSPSVLRVSVRDGEGYIGYLTSFKNVPGLFGSVPYQSYHYIGVDCADVLMAAYARWKGESSVGEYNVGGVIKRFPIVCEFDIEKGHPSREIRWGRDVKPGYFIAVRYRGRTQYQHIGAVYRDANRNGLLDTKDTVLHAGPGPLQATRLEQGGFGGHVVVLKVE